jgi:hypothetical protein
MKSDPAFPHLLILDLQDHEDRQHLISRYGQAAANVLPAAAVLGEVLAPGSPCGCVVVESDYIDRNSNTAYARLYARAFRDYPRRTTRFHFFRKLIAFGDLFHQKRLQASYLGFSVLSPLEPRTVARTVLAPLGATPHTNDVLCAGEYTVDLAGAQLRATGAPFIEQDGRVAACATAALWMATLAMSRHFDDELRTASTTEITDLATRYTLGTSGRPVPNPGLNLEQMLWALKELGYDPVVYYPGDHARQPARAHEDAKEITYSYVESRLAPVLVVELPGGLHAVTVVGHTYDAAFTPSAHSALPYYSAAQWCPHFLVNDDQNGPYLRMAFTRSSAATKGRPGVSISLDEVKDNAYFARTSSFYKDAVLRAIIIPMPRRVYLRADEAAEKGRLLILRAYLEHKHQFSLVFPKRPVYRTYLVSSNVWKEYLRPSAVPGLSRELAKRFRGKLLSRLVWVTELCDLEDKAGKKPEELRVRALALVDSTSGPSIREFLAIWWPGLFIPMAPQDQDFDAALLHPVLLPYDQPFRPFIPA